MDGRDYLLTRVGTHLEEMVHLAETSRIKLPTQAIALEGANSLVGSIQHRVAKVGGLDIDDFGEFGTRPPTTMTLTLSEPWRVAVAKGLPPHPARISHSLAENFWTLELPREAKLDTHGSDRILERIVRDHRTPGAHSPSIIWIREVTHVVVTGFLDTMLAAFAFRTSMSIAGLGTFVPLEAGAVECVADEAILRAMELRILRERETPMPGASREFASPEVPPQGSEGIHQDADEPPPPRSPDALERYLRSEGLRHRARSSPS